MTAQSIASAPVQRLEGLAALYLEGEWTPGREAELYALAPGRPEAAILALFEEFARMVDVRDGVCDGRTDWREVDPEITGWDPSVTAYEAACGWVADAALALLNGRHR